MALGAMRPAQLQRLAELVGREKSTLEQYLKVSAVFPESRRNYDLAWGVFKQLARVEDEGWQDDYVAANPAATTSQTERAVNAKLRADGAPGARRRYSDQARVPGVEVSLSVFGNDLTKVQLTLSGAIDQAELVYSEVHQQWRVDFAMKPDGSGSRA